MGKDTRISVTLDFNADLKNIQGAVGNVQKSLQGLSLPQGLNKNFLSLFSNLEAEIKNFGSLASKELTTAGDFSAVEKSGKKILDLYRKLGVEIDSLSDTDKMKLFPPNTIADINKINNAMKQFNSATDKNKKAIDAANKGVAKYSAEINSLKERQAAVRQKEIVDPVQFSKAQKDIKKYREEVEALQAELDSKKADTKARMEKDGRTSPDKRTKEYKAELAVQQQLETALKNLTDARTAADKITTKTRQINELERLKKAYDEAETNLNSYREELKKLGDGGEAEAFKKMMESLKDVDGIDPSSIKSFKDLEEALQDIKTKAGDDVDEKIEEIVAAMRAAQGPADQFGDNMREAGDSIKEMSRDAQDLENLKHRILDFFSISNAVQLFKRAINSAFDTVKELDATMTEAAVVTDFSVGDMWDKLPEYSAGASKLGATINDLYGATTLYYQQGLKNNEAMALGTETMKMARIAGMESAEATEAMTAALRGFNMELNETSATRVNDVYSELAAITAADTEQIATAMSKTASIASAANMEFESTAAFLSQIIETTQEAPETAGTALKTIIARFSEVKSLREKGLSSGEDSEGELIDVNKIQGALRTVGISMDEFFAGTEGLDSVLMKLAAKWGTLDFETQRYIATTAAGSRQQSRFIAMMSNYDRTMELVSAANNSAGASQEQFNKTLESLDSKLNNLKDAWDQFVMGLANNELIKAGVDVLTSLLTTVNKIISSMSGGSGVVKTFVTAFAAIGTFKLGQKGLNKFLGNAAPKEGILAAILGKGKSGEAKTLGIGWGRDAVSGFKDSFTKGAKDIFSGKKMTNFLFGNMGPIDTTSLQENLKSQLDKTPFIDQEVEPIKLLIDQGKTQEAAQQMQQLAEKAQQAGYSTEELGADMELINGAADGTIQKGQEMGKTLGQIGTYGAMAGAALMSMIPMLEEMGASDEVIAVIKGVAIALMALPVVMKIVEFATHAFAKGTTAAISSIPIIGWIAAAISALIALGSILATVIDTPEEKLKKANASLESATEAASKLSEAYNNISKSLEEIKSNEDAFDNLIEGTLEWKEALLDNNQAILDLIKDVPELAAFVQNVDGKLIIDYEKQNAEGKTVDQVMSDKLDSSIQAQDNVLAAQSEVYEAENLVFMTDFIRDQMGTNLYNAVNTGNVINPEKILEGLIRSQINLEDKEAVTKFLEDNYSSWFPETDSAGNTELSSFAGAVSSSADALNEFGNAILENGAKITSQTDLMASNFMEHFIKENNLTGAESEIAKDFGTGQRLDSIANSLEKNYISNIGKNEDYKNFMKETYGKDVTITKKGVVKDKDGNVIVEADSGKEMYSQHQAGQQMVAGAKSYVKAVSQIDNETTKSILSGNQGTNATKKELQSIFGEGVDLASVLEDGKIEEEEASGFVADLKDVWENLDEETKQNIYGGDMQKFIDEGMEKLFNATQTYAEAINTQSELEKKGATFDWADEFSASQLEGLNKVYQTALSTGGTEGLKAVSDAMSALLTNEIQEQDQGKILDAFNSIDWTSATAIEDFEQTLSDAGLVAYTSGELFNELMDQMKNTTVSIKTFNLGQIRDEIRNSMDLVNELKDKKDSSFDEETKKKLIKTGAASESDFVWNGQDFIYVGGTMEELAAAVAENTNATMDNTIAQLEKKIEQGQQFGNIFENTGLAYTSVDGGFTKDDFLSGKVTSGEAAADFMFYGMSDDDVLTDVETGKTYNRKDLIAEGNEEVALRLYNQGYDSFTHLTENKDALVSTEQARAIGGRSADEVRAAGESEELQKAASITEAQNAGLDTSEIMNRADRIQEGLEGTDYKISEAMATELAKTEGIMNQGAKELSDGWGDITKALAPSNKGTLEYSNALEDLGKSTKKFLGISGDLSDKFLESAKSSGLLGKALSGDKKAFNDLQKEATKDILKKFLDESEEIPEHIEKMADEVADADLEIGATVEVDTNSMETDGLAYQLSSIYDQAYRSAIEGGQSVADAMAYANEVMAAEGFKAPEMEMKEVTLTGDLPAGWTPVANGVVNGPDGQPLTGVKWTQDDTGQYTYTQTMMVPKDGGNFTKTSEKIGNGSKKKGGGGGNKPKKQHWDNPYDKLYNITEEIEELQRDRNVLEEEFNDLMEDGWLNAEKVNEAINKQAENLSRELTLQRKVTAERKKQLASIQQEKYTYTKRKGKKEEEVTATYKNAWSALGLDKTLGMSFEQLFKYDEERGVKILDVEALNKIVENQDLGEDQGALVESIIGKAEEWISSLEEAEDAALELEKQLKELEDIGKEEAIEAENRLAEALQELRQREINDMQLLSETLSEANSSILDSLQESIDLERQIRDNTKQEEDIADMEARLAYLRRDTSGANQQEILQLEEQLGDARESYSDSLVDQQLQKLSDSNAKAEEQRQQQIELAQAQLDYQVESGEILREAENMLKTMSPEKIKEILKEAENYDALSKIQQMDWMNDTNNLLEGWKIGMKNWELEEVKDKEGTINAKDEDGNALKLRYDKEKGKWVDDATGNTYSAATWDEEKGTYMAYGKTEPEGASDGGTPTDLGDQTPTETYPYGKPSEATKTVKKGQSGQRVKAVQYALNKLGYGNSGTDPVDGKFGSNTEKAVKAFQGAMNISKDGKVGPKTRAKFKAKQFKTGGIADFTGPAWLDGTKSKPEIILNQQDSKNFIMLKDILGEILQGATSGKSAEKSGGDNYFDISIIVDEISSDYDVDKMAARIKQQIYDDSTYRNVNAINLIR